MSSSVPGDRISLKALRKRVVPEELLRCGQHEHATTILRHIRHVLDVDAPTGLSSEPVSRPAQLALNVIEPPVIVAVHDVVDVLKDNDLRSITRFKLLQQTWYVEEGLAPAVIKASSVACLREALTWESGRQHVHRCQAGVLYANITDVLFDDTHSG